MKAKILAILIILLATKVDAQVLINYGIPETSLSTSSTGVVTGTVYNLPTTYAAIVTWQVVADGSALSVNLEGSLDNSTFFTIDTQTTAAGGIKNFGFTAVKYVRISQVSRTGGTATTGTLIVNRGFINGGSFTLNNILAGDGTAGAPAYSFLSQPNTGFYFLNGNTVFTKSAVVKWLYGATELGYGSSYSIGWSSQVDPTNGGNDTSLSRGGAAGKVVLSGTTPMFMFGGTTNLFSAFKGNATEVQVRLADDSGFGTIRTGTIIGSTGSITADFQTGHGSVLFHGTAPTISSGFGTSPTIPNNNGTAAFTINVGTGAVATSGVIGLPAASNGWNCYATDITATAAHTTLETRQTASTTTTATIESQNRATGAATAWAASSILRVACFGF
jgi:hypothetical protein